MAACACPSMPRAVPQSAHASSRVVIYKPVKVENRDSKCDFLKKSKYFFFT